MTEDNGELGAEEQESPVEKVHTITIILTVRQDRTAEIRYGGETLYPETDEFEEERENMQPADIMKAIETSLAATKKAHRQSRAGLYSADGQPI